MPREDDDKYGDDSPSEAKFQGTSDFTNQINHKKKKFKMVNIH